MTALAASKTRSAADAISAITSGMVVATGSLSSEPLSLTSALWENAKGLKDVTIVSGMMLTGYPFLLNDRSEAFKLRTWFMPGTLLGGDAKNVKADFLPLTWAQTVRYLTEQAFDAVLVQVSPADANGYHSFGLNTSQARATLNKAKLVIAEVNEAMPRTRGDSLIHESAFDILVPADHALPEFPHREGDDIDREIGRLAAELVPDGATLQFGIGTIPGAALDGLIELGRRDISVISQMTDPARKLIESGVCVTSNPKALVGDVLGTHALYEWMDDNDQVHMTDGLTTHSIEKFAKRSGFVSINSALEIDLYGQLNADFLNGLQVGGIGGSVDFTIGAQVAGNRSIIALRSRTKRGVPRIVPNLNPGPVTVPRTLIQYVVTEYGVADLRNKTVRERALALAQIAHPDDRDALAEAAARLS